MHHWTGLGQLSLHYLHCLDFDFFIKEYWGHAAVAYVSRCQLSDRRGLRFLRWIRHCELLSVTSLGRSGERSVDRAGRVEGREADAAAKLQPPKSIEPVSIESKAMTATMPAWATVHENKRSKEVTAHKKVRRVGFVKGEARSAAKRTLAPQACVLIRPGSLLRLAAERSWALFLGRQARRGGAGSAGPWRLVQPLFDAD